MHHDNHLESILTQPNPQLGMEDQASLCISTFIRQKSLYKAAKIIIWDNC